MADNFNNNKRISALSLVGRDRYDQYVQELSAQGTIGGEQLSPSERKEAFKRRNNKVQFKTFVERVLQKKAVANAKVKPKGIRALPGTAVRERGGALIKYRPAAAQEVKKSSFDILKVLDSILTTLKNQFKFDKKTAEEDRKDEERERRSKRESALESVKKIGKKIVDKVVAPFKSIFDRIWNFILYTLLGRAFTKLMDWLGDPKNKKKISTLVRFFKDWWPSILVGALAFFTPLGSLIATITGTIIASIARIAAVNPLLAAAIATVAGASKLMGDTRRANQRAIDEARKKKGSQLTPEEEAKAVTQKMTSPLMGGFVVPTLVEQQLSQPPIPKKNIGGLIGSNTGMRISGAGPDTQLTALQPGEVVMNRATVSAVGANNLLALNARYGGSNANQPRFANNVQFAQFGGLIGGKPMGLRGADLMRIMHGTAEGIPELIRKTGFRGQTGMLGKGVYGSVKGWVADTYRGAGALKGILPGQGPRLNMLVPQTARTFRGATVVSERQANRGLRIAEGILSGKYTGAKARSLMPLLTKATPSMAQAFGTGALKLLGRATAVLNAPVIGDMLTPEAAGGGSTLQEAMAKGYYKGPMPTPPPRARSTIMNLPPITQSAASTKMTPAAGTQIPSFPAVSASGGSDRSTNASIYGII